MFPTFRFEPIVNRMLADVTRILTQMFMIKSREKRYLTYFDMDLWPCCDLFGLPPPQVAGVAGVSRWSLTCIESTTRPGAPSRGWSRQWTKASGTSPKRWKRKKCWRTQWLDMLDVECAKICQNVPKEPNKSKQPNMPK